MEQASECVSLKQDCVKTYSSKWLHLGQTLLLRSQCLSTISIQGCGYFTQAENTPIFENSLVLCRIWWILDIQSSCGISWCRNLQIKPFEGPSSSSPSLTFIDLHYNLQTATFWISRTWFSQEHKKHWALKDFIFSSVAICAVTIHFLCKSNPRKYLELAFSITSWKAPKFKFGQKTKAEPHR